MRLAVGLIVFAALLRGLVWGALLPPWQGPDEPAHFAYIQRIATKGEILAQDLSPPEFFSVATNASVSATSFGPSRTRQPLRYLRRGLPAFPVKRDHLSQINHGGLIVWKYPPGVLPDRDAGVPAAASSTPIPSASMQCATVSAVIGAITVLLVLLLLLEARRPRLG